MRNERELTETLWDAIVVIGTGMGGGTLGYELSGLGHRVLFLEKGYSHIGSACAIQGRYPEETFDLARITDGEHDEFLARGGRNVEWFRDTTPGREPKTFRPIMGSGKDDCLACQTFLCAAGCKNHAGNVCVEPAVHHHGATLLDRSTVTRPGSTRTAVTGVVARRDGRTLAFRGKVVIVAAGALMTPVLLLNSASRTGPGAWRTNTTSSGGI